VTEAKRRFVGAATAKSASVSKRRNEISPGGSTEEATGGQERRTKNRQNAQIWDALPGFSLLEVCHGAVDGPQNTPHSGKRL